MGASSPRAGALHPGCASVVRSAEGRLASQSDVELLGSLGGGGGILSAVTAESIHAKASPGP